MTKDLAYYVKKFSPRSIVGKEGLNVSLKNGIALNKPILLLSVIEMIATGQITKNQIPFNPELIATFLKLWSHLETVRKPDIGLPFYHLTSDRFWHYQMKPGFEGMMQAKAKIRTPSIIRETVDYAYLDDELWELLQNESVRTVLTHTLIDSWFKERTQDIESLLQVNAFAELQEQLRSQGGKVYKPEELKDEQQKIVRDGGDLPRYVQNGTHCKVMLRESLQTQFLRLFTVIYARTKFPISSKALGTVSISIK